jgi:hypothetical protein
VRGLIIYEFARYKTLVTNITAMARQSPENLGHLCHEDWHGECFMTYYAGCKLQRKGRDGHMVSHFLMSFGCFTFHYN